MRRPWGWFTSRLKSRRKVFCIGRNKTGTTSLKQALTDLGFRVGDQRRAERLVEDWARRDFRRLVRYCQSADAFQDVPFSKPYTFQAMDAAFPGSKFVLSIRDDVDQWYDSLVRFQSERLERAIGEYRLPKVADMGHFDYVEPGWSLRMRELDGVDVHDPEACSYPESQLKADYERHNETVLDYFRHRPGDLLVLNVAWPDAMARLCAFLGCGHEGQEMPRLNATVASDDGKG